MATTDKRWVNFNEVKQNVRFEEVLAYLGLAEGLEKIQTKAGMEWCGPCPLHERSDAKGKSLNVNVDKQKFFCHACKKGGNVLDFVAALRQEPVLDAAVWLREQFIDPRGEGSASGAPSPETPAVSENRAEELPSGQAPAYAAAEAIEQLPEPHQH